MHGKSQHDVLIVSFLTSGALYAIIGEYVTPIDKRYSVCRRHYKKKNKHTYYDDCLLLG